jgi:histidine ammonia-lyase
MRVTRSRQKTCENCFVESEIMESHRNCGKIQDPYCLRCVPQVHGAVRDAIVYSVVPSRPKSTP